MSQIKLTADSGGGTTSLKAPSSTTSNADVVLKLPVADGSSGEILKTDGSGQLSFGSNAGTTINNNADNRIITGSGTASTLNGESTLTYSGDTLLSTNSNFVIKSIDTNASNAENYIQFNAGYITYDSDSSNSTGYSGHYFQADGAEKLRINGSGQLIFDADTNTYIARPAADTLAVTTGGTERLRIDSSGSLLVGATSYGGGGNTPSLYVSSTSGRQAKIHNTNANTTSLQLTNASTGEGEDAGMMFATLGTSGDGWINNAENAAIRFGTNGNERMRILAGGGLTFNGDTADANALDDYEEGTWTPTSNIGTITVHNASYIKIGNLITYRAYISFPSMSGVSNVEIQGFPFQIWGSDYHTCPVNSDANLGDNLVGQYYENTGSTDFMNFAKSNNVKATVTEMSGHFIIFVLSVIATT